MLSLEPELCFLAGIEPPSGSAHGLNESLRNQDLLRYHSDIFSFFEHFHIGWLLSPG
jgi:hypothetical protein